MAHEARKQYKGREKVFFCKTFCKHTLGFRKLLSRWFRARSSLSFTQLRRIDSL